MTDFQIRTQFEALEIKLRKLVLGYQNLKKTLDDTLIENQALKENLVEAQLENQELQKDNQDLQKKLNQQVKNFKKSDKITKIAVNNLKSTGNPAELKEKLDEYILEIEKCISQLSN
jgi:regulator of replication initiation timing